MLERKRLIGLATCVTVLCTAGPGLAARLAAPVANPAGIGGGSWEVSLRPSGSDARLYPGGAPVRFELTLTNLSGSDLSRAAIAPSLAVDPATGEVRSQSGKPVRGCLAGWFRVAPETRRSPLSVPPRGSYRGVIDVAMIDASVNQDACEGHAPVVRVSVTSG